ncbi:MAG TPA: hypothetical protein PLB25_12585 [Rhodoferax sp.]|nr:hypothetical protein [Rhodoferax sp.]
MAARSIAGQDDIKVKVPFARWPAVKQRATQFDTVPNQVRQICQYPASLQSDQWGDCYDTNGPGRGNPPAVIVGLAHCPKAWALLRVEQAAPASLFDQGLQDQPGRQRARGQRPESYLNNSWQRIHSNGLSRFLADPH